MSYRYRGPKWLKQRFAHSRPGQICGEITAVYIHAPESAALISQDMPHAKLIVMLRDPVERLYSFYYLLRRIYPLPDCFDDFIKKHPEYVETSLYYKQLSRYYKYFANDSFHYIFYDDLRKKPEEVMSGVYTFLGVDTTVSPANIREKVNPRMTTRSTAMVRFMGGAAQLIKRNRAGVACLQLLGILGIDDLSRNIFMSNWNPSTQYIPNINKDTRKYLVNYYREDIRQLERHTARKLSHWYR